MSSVHWTKGSIGIFFLMLMLSPALGAEEQADPTQPYRDFFQDFAISVESVDDLSPMFEALADRRFVLLGESTHGTHEYYVWRDQISRRLISEKGFSFVAVEGDWNNIEHLNDYVKHRTSEDLEVLMLAKDRWPEWMWANQEFAAFVEWLREHNRSLEPEQRAGIYGLDMQDPEGAAAEVLKWFARHDPEYHEQIEQAYDALLGHPGGLQGYAGHLAQGGERAERQAAGAVERLQELGGSGFSCRSDKALWNAKQNALAVQRAEAQFNAMARGAETRSWNKRAQHMHESFLRIADCHGDGSRGLVWAHNTHVGDAFATIMRTQGQVNIGQLLRQSEGVDEVFILGFSTHSGEVVAGSEWGGSRQVMAITPAQPGTIEALLHESDLTQALLLFDGPGRHDDLIMPLNHRAIGVVYNPEQEGWVPSLMPWRYDALLYIDQTSALTPVHP